MRLLLGLIFSFLCVCCTSYAQGGRSVQSINSYWQFFKGENPEENQWQAVNLPHSWNTTDPFDEENGYYRGVGWYRRGLHVEDISNKKFLHFEGANQTAEVYVNGRLAGVHAGGYTAFNVPVSEFLQLGDNEIKIRVDNSHNPDIAPIKGDFNFYGGIYRDVWLIQTSDTHFDFSEYGDLGIFVSTPKVSKEEASLVVRANVTAGDKGRAIVTYQLVSPGGQEVINHSESISLKRGMNEFQYSLPEVRQPQLWHPGHPALYALTIELKDKKGEVLDRQQLPVGFRWFSFDADEGFFINGEHLKLAGSNRHQDYAGQANALSDDRHIEDMKLIKNMGSNFTRLAHYPQDPAVLSACDQLGLLVSMEIPLDHEISDTEAFYDNSKFMMQEMIRQNYNHPSVIIWAYMNEMLLGRQLERDKEKIDKIEDFAQVLEALTRREDSTRYTMIPNHGALHLYYEAGLTKIPMIIGWNLYYGWYGATMGAAGFLDDYHELVPDKPMIVTEYGAGADPRIRSFDPVRFDFSVEWETRFHQENFKDFVERPFVAGSTIWNLADFGSENRNDAVPKINSKGIVSMARQPKDSYYLYQSLLKKTPFVKIGGCDWSHRVDYGEGSITHPFEVFSNGRDVNLTVNGQAAKQVAIDNNLSKWQVPLHDGQNILQASARFQDTTTTDVCKIELQTVNKSWMKSNRLHINCGANFFFDEPVDDIAWLPDRAYAEDFCGYVGGNVYKPRNNGLGSDRDILNTNLEPVYQTARVNPDYKFDLPKGKYEITFYWAETEVKYDSKKGKRIFNVLVNNKLVLKNLNIMDAGFNTAYSKKVITQIHQPGLEVSFQAVEGEPIINAIAIKKL